MMGTNWKRILQVVSIIVASLLAGFKAWENEEVVTIKGTTGFKQFVGSVAVIAPQYGYGVSVVDLMIRQAALESGWGSSNLAQSWNNFIGMRCVQVRKTTQTGCTDAGWGTYATPGACARDLVLWYVSNGIPKTGYENAKEAVLRAGYVTDAEEDGYSEALDKFQSFQNIAVLAPVGLLSGIIAPLVFIGLKLKK